MTLPSLCRWLDAQTRLLLEDMLGLGPTITISVRPGLPPATLTQQQVCAAAA